MFDKEGMDTEAARGRKGGKMKEERMTSRYGIVNYGIKRFEVQDLQEGRKVCITDTQEQAQKIIEALEQDKTSKR